MPTQIDALAMISKGRKYSSQKISEMRKAIEKDVPNPDIFVGVFGSFARKEASEESDLDFCVFYKGDKNKGDADAVLKTIGPKLVKIAGKKPADEGAFNVIDRYEEALKNIGGDDDSNPKITRRVLLLLESDWLANQSLFENLRKDLLGMYVRDTITAHQLALFLLNDLIRYYRTICVDFDFKTIQKANPKPWGTRNIKLIFSRKLIYFSGILVIAETYQRTYLEKMRIMEELFALTSIERLLRVCGDNAMPPLKLYDEFLDAMSSAEIRAILEKATEANRSKLEEFRKLKDAGHHFSMRLMNLLRITFDQSHPIHRALVL